MKKRLLPKKITFHPLSITILLAVLLIGGGILRFYNLGNIFLYWDEPIRCVRIAYQPLPFVVAYNNASAFFAILVHFLLPLGKTEIMARLPSAVFGVLSIIALYFLGKIFFSKKEGLIAAFFIAFSPLLIRFSQYSRAYSTFTFLSILSLYFFFRALRENKTKFWILYCLFTILNIYNHLAALFIIPVYGIYVGIIWLKGKLGRGKSQQKKSEPDILKKFILWTLLVFFLVILLYLPDVNARNYIFTSAERAKEQPSEASFTFFQVKRLLLAQLSPRNSFFFQLLLSFGLLGLLSSTKKYPLEVIFSFLYILLPLSIFILIRPNPPAILSAWRYYIFILPLLYLLIARGIIFLGTVITVALSRIKALKINESLMKKIGVGALTVFLIGGLEFKNYYLNFWRLGSFRVEREVSDFFRRNVKEDSMIFFDFFPASNLNLVINPITKNLRLEHGDSAIRRNLVATKEENDFIVYRIIEIDAYENLIKSRAGLWAVTELDSGRRKKLSSFLPKIPNMIVIDIEKYTILHFERDDKPLSHKLGKLAEILLSLNLEPYKGKQFHLLAAKAYLLNDKVEEALQELKKAKEIVLEPGGTKTKKNPLIFQALDKIFGLNDQKLRLISENNSYNSFIAGQLLIKGDNFRKLNQYQNAERLYRECLKLREDYNLKIANRLVLLGDEFFSQGDTEEAIRLYQKALELNPKRYFLEFVIAEAYRKGGDYSQARKEYGKAFGLDSLSPQNLDKIIHHPSSIVIWEKNSVWHLLFLSNKKSIFSGQVLASHQIKEIKKFHFSGKDSLQFSEKKIKFHLDTRKKIIKAIEFRVPQGCRLTFDLKTNGRRKIENIILLEREPKPRDIPLTIY
jgi:tetratricopeptide (TPR) repeat protein